MPSINRTRVEPELFTIINSNDRTKLKYKCKCKSICIVITVDSRYKATHCLILVPTKLFNVKVYGKSIRSQRYKATFFPVPWGGFITRADCNWIMKQNSVLIFKSTFIHLYNNLETCTKSLYYR